MEEIAWNRRKDVEAFFSWIVVTIFVAQQVHEVTLSPPSAKNSATVLSFVMDLWTLQIHYKYLWNYMFVMNETAR